MTMSSEEFVVQSLQGDRKLNITEAEASIEKSMLDVYGARLSKKCLTPAAYKDLSNMNFQTFVAKHRLVRGGDFKPREKEAIVIFYPRPSGNVKGKKYAEYCRLSLIKFMPWVGELTSAWGGKDQSPEVIVAAWETFKGSAQFQELGVCLLADRKGLDDVRDQEREEAAYRQQSLDDARAQDDTIFCGDFRSEDELREVYHTWRTRGGAVWQDFDWGESYHHLCVRMLDNEMPTCADLRQWLDVKEATWQPETNGEDSSDEILEKPVLNEAQAVAIGVFTSHAAALAADRTAVHALVWRRGMW